MLIIIIIIIAYLPPVPDRVKVRNLPLELRELDALVVTKAIPKRVR